MDTVVEAAGRLLLGDLRLDDLCLGDLRIVELDS